MYRNLLNQKKTKTKLNKKKTQKTTTKMICTSNYIILEQTHNQHDIRSNIDRPTPTHLFEKQLAIALQKNANDLDPIRTMHASLKWLKFSQMNDDAQQQIVQLSHFHIG